VSIVAPSIASSPFGTTAAGDPVDLYTLSGCGSVEVSVMTYGAAIHQLWAPGRDGQRANVALGFPTLAGYLAHDGHYFGATVGRYANRISGGRFTLDSVVYELPRSDGDNSLHGGTHGFDKCLWRASVEPAGDDEARLALRYTSRAGEMGYPGTLDVEVVYTLAGCALRIDFRATTDAPTVVNLTNHTLWNMAGEGSGAVDGHLLTLNASAYTPVGPGLLPTGEVSAVDGTPLDFRVPAPIGGRLQDGFEQLELAHGYDHNFVLDRVVPDALELAALLEDPGSGRTLEVLTTEPGVQLYSGNSLDGTLVGTSGRPYQQRDGVALETQHFPDSPNRPEFPSTVLQPGEIFASTTVFRLGTR
jgi:aldose 1-epimerase